jgi:hypothetical protein
MQRLNGLLTALFLTLSIAPVFAQGDWIPAADLDHQRQRHSATLLDSGKLLVAGGAYDFWGEVATATCELYDPSTDSWSYAGAMTTPRSSHTSTRLPDGRVMVIGGYAGNGLADSSCEIYDPTTDTWSAVAPMNVRRYRHQAILLNADSILVIGGRQGTIDGYESMAIWGPLSSCEIYSISNDTWTMAGSMNELRTETGVSLLPDGRVLAAGGIHDLLIMSNCAQQATASCEIYDPVTDTWSLTDSLVYARNFVRLQTLDDNSVLTVGGELDKDALSDCHLFSVDSSNWISTGTLNDPRIVSEVLKLPTGDVMTVGGWAYLWSSQTSTAEIYNVASESWNSLPSMDYNRGWHTATMLNNGDVIVVGGTSDDRVALKSCEIFRFEQQPLSIFAVSDVPNDEGGLVNLYWSAHTFDSPSQGADRISSYTIYLKDEEHGNTVAGLPTGKWRAVAHESATAQRRYSAAAPTLMKSITKSDPASVFVVVAEAKSGKSFVSATATGRSFDNRGPAIVGSVSIARNGNDYKLDWNSSRSEDVQRYAIYRGSSRNFPVSPENRIAVTTSRSYTDQSVSTGKPIYYRVQAIDNSNNPGLATPPSGTTLSVNDYGVTGSNLRVQPNYPQPFSSLTTIPVWLRSPAVITVEVFDNLSRQVARMPNIQMSGGDQVIRLNSGSLPSGHYTCVIYTGDESKVLPLIIQK